MGCSPDNRNGFFNGLELPPKEGRTAFPRIPDKLDLPLPRSVGRRLGDRLIARSRTSGYALARLDRVGDWKDGWRIERDTGNGNADLKAAVPSLVRGRFGGEFIVWGVFTFRYQNKSASHRARG